MGNNSHYTPSGCDLEPPQGLKLDLNTGTVRIVRDEQVKPRMAAVLDFLWYEKKLPFMASLVGGVDGFTLTLPPAALKEFGDTAYQLIEGIKIHLIDPAKISSTQANNKDHYIGYLELQRPGFPQCRKKYTEGKGPPAISSPAVRLSDHQRLHHQALILQQPGAGQALYCAGQRSACRQPPEG